MTKLRVPGSSGEPPALTLYIYVCISVCIHLVNHLSIYIYSHLGIDTICKCPNFGTKMEMSLVIPEKIRHFWIVVRRLLFVHVHTYKYTCIYQYNIQLHMFYIIVYIYIYRYIYLYLYLFIYIFNIYLLYVH